MKILLFKKMQLHFLCIKYMYYDISYIPLCLCVSLSQGDFVRNYTFTECYIKNIRYVLHDGIYFFLVWYYRSKEEKNM